MSSIVNRATPPSAHDVARRAGVSQAAVSRAFTPGASIAKATRERVLQAAKELGYRPNLLARSLITGRSGLIGVVIGSPRNPFFLEALDSLSEQLAGQGLHLMVFTASIDSHADELVDALLRFRVDTLLLMSATVSPELGQECRDAGIPVIFYNRRARVIDGFPSVTGANTAGPAVIAQHLIDQGYRRFGYIGGTPGSTTSQEREAGFTARLVKQGFPPPATAYGHYDREGTIAAAKELMALDSPPDAIFCANDMTGLALIDYAREQRGIAIGRELGVAGFDDIEGASWPTFDLTTYSQPTNKMMAKVVELILDPGKLGQAGHIVVEGELKVRDSTRRA